MAPLHRPSPDLPEHLRTLYDGFRFDRSLGDDPLELVRPYRSDPRSAEIAGLFAATLAIGNTTAIRRSFAEVERRIGSDWSRFVESSGGPGDRQTLRGFRHRWIRGDQLVHLARRLRATYARHPSLEELFREGTREGGFAGGIARLSEALRGPPRPAAPAGYVALFPHPGPPGRSACKRLTLFVRWMVRRDYPDLGLWRSIDPSELRIPLDQHVFWIAYNLGLTHRKTRNWAAVEEISEALRRVDPVDPMRFDFVLCHTGISGDCPKHRELSICGACAVRPDCRLWAGRTGAGG